MMQKNTFKIYYFINEFKLSDLSHLGKNINIIYRNYDNIGHLESILKLKKSFDMKLKTILVSQPEPASDKSPYARIQEKFKLKIDFRPFIHVEGVDAKSVRTQKIDFANFDNIILTSRNAVDHFFRLTEEMRFKVPDSTKYFCLSEAVAFYLQKYVVYRKRKIYVGDKSIEDLSSVLLKFGSEKYLLPTSDILKPSIPKTLDKLDLNWKRAELLFLVEVLEILSSQQIQQQFLEQLKSMLMLY